MNLTVPVAIISGFDNRPLNKFKRIVLSGPNWKLIHKLNLIPVGPNIVVIVFGWQHPFILFNTVLVYFSYLQNPILCFLV